MRKHIRNGLYVGKFMAYHKGHQNCINRFSYLCDKLNLIICGNTKTDLIPLEIRKNWLERELQSTKFINRNKIKLHTLIEDNITPYPEGLKEWCNVVENLIQEKVDVMFGNEDYVRESAREFGSAYFIPDQARTYINVSSTKIIKNGLKYYDFLADVTKPYFNKKVLLIGAESTGKSTLCRKLSAFFDGKYVGEYGREYEEESIRHFNRNCKEWSVNDYNYVAKIQNQQIEELMSKPNNRLVFVDTDALITQLYCQEYIHIGSKVIDEIIKKQKYDLIFFLSHNNTNWVADGIRNLENQRDKISNVILEKMKEFNKEYRIIDNNEGYDKRFIIVKNIIKDKFNI
jgi:HTH-type transcriptional repressor of NAD biosynthesis genes